MLEAPFRGPNRGRRPHTRGPLGPLIRPPKGGPNQNRSFAKPKGFAHSLSGSSEWLKPFGCKWGTLKGSRIYTCTAFQAVHYIMGEYTPFSLRGKGLSNGQIPFGNLPSGILAAER